MQWLINLISEKVRQDLQGILNNAGAVNPGPDAVYINPCDGGADAAFDDLESNCTVTADTTYTRCYKTNAQSQKITKGNAAANCLARETLAAPLDLSDAYAFAVRFYIHEGSGISSWTHITTIEIYFYNELVDSVLAKLLVPTASMTLSPGWNEVNVSRSRFVGALDDWAGITHIGFRFYTDENSEVPAVTLDRIVALPKLTKPMLYFCFDDGYASQFEAFQHFQAHGYPATLSLQTSNVPANLTWSQLRTMDQAGWLIANHTRDHINWLTATLAQKKSDVRNGMNDLIENGLTRGAYILATPGGDYDFDEDNEHILGTYAAVIRSARQHTSGMTNRFHVPYGSERMVVPVATLVDLSSDGNRDILTAAIDDAITDGCNVGCLLHEIISEAQFTRLEAILDHIDTKVAADTLAVGTLAEIPSFERSI